MGTGYQERDYEVINYELWRLAGIGAALRGPKPPTLVPGRYVSCLGAAQTFGCYAPQPYPSLLSQALDVGVVNLGVAGAGPKFFLDRPAFLTVANQGNAAVLQVLSGRSVSNSLFDSGGKEMLTRRSDGVVMGAAPMYEQFLGHADSELVDRVLAETRERWVNEFGELIRAIEVPTVLLWLSVRPPDYDASHDSVQSLFGDFPQLINREMIDGLRADCTAYVECVSREGLPQPLCSRFSGAAVSVPRRADLGGGTRAVNSYYASPQMHCLAARQLLDEARGVLS